MTEHHDTHPQTVLVLGATGKTGRRVAQSLRARDDVTVRAASRSAAGAERFDWQDPTTFAPAVRGVDAVYLVHMPEVTAPTAAAEITAFMAEAVTAGVRRVVLLSAYGFPGAVRDAEQAVTESGVPEWTILVPNWFSQNFSEDFLRDPVLSGTIELPSGEGRAPYIDAEDIAAVAVAALTESGHHGQRYTLTGASSLTMAEVAAEISAATGRDIGYREIGDEEFTRRLRADGLPDDAIHILGELMRLMREGDTEERSDDVRRVLGREPRAFADFVRAAAPTGVWDVQDRDG